MRTNRDRYIIIRSLSHILLPPSASRHAKVPRVKYLVTSSPIISPDGGARAIRWPIYRLSGAPVRWQPRFSYRLSRDGDPDPTTRSSPSFMDEPNTSNQPPAALRIDHPTGLRRACALPAMLILIVLEAARR